MCQLYLETFIYVGGHTFGQPSARGVRVIERQTETAHSTDCRYMQCGDPPGVENYLTVVRGEFTKKGFHKYLSCGSKCAVN